MNARWCVCYAAMLAALISHVALHKWMWQGIALMLSGYYYNCRAGWLTDKSLVTLLMKHLAHVHVVRVDCATGVCCQEERVAWYESAVYMLIVLNAQYTCGCTKCTVYVYKCTKYAVSISTTYLPPLLLVSSLIVGSSCVQMTFCCGAWALDGGGSLRVDMQVPPQTHCLQCWNLYSHWLQFQPLWQQISDVPVDHTSPLSFEETLVFAEYLWQLHTNRAVVHVHVHVQYV